MIEELLKELRRRDIRLWTEGDRLKYEAPEGALTDDLLARIRAGKQAIIERLAGASSAVREPIPRVDRSCPLPLSFAQQRMWFLWKLEPKSPAYIVPILVKLTGPLDVRALIDGLRLIQRRHEVLRTRFVETVDGARQVIDDAADLDVRVIDLSDLAPDAAEAEARRRWQDETEIPFDLTASPPLAVRLYQVGSGASYLLVKLHHIVLDGWSNQLLMSELWAAYQSLHACRAPELPELPVQYGDFSVWQRRRFQRPLQGPAVSYWRRQLEGDFPPLDLPTRTSAPAAGTAGDRVSFLVSPELRAELSRLGQRHRTTMFMMLTTALRVLLYRYTGQGDALIGTPTIRRQHPETESLIGYFGNTLLLRSRLEPADTYLDALARERRIALDAYDHQELPFDLLVEELAPERRRPHSPLFQVMFLFGERAPSTHVVGDLNIEFVDALTSAAKLDLGLWVTHRDDGALHGHFEYPTGLFDRATIERLSRHFVRIVEDIARRPEQGILGTPLLTAEEEQLVLREWNATAAPRRDPGCLHERFEERAAATPDATAIHHGADAVTYAQLDAEADRLAARLRAEGIGPGQLVGVCLRRTPRLVAALLGVLKAGAAYVPLDPCYPDARIALLLGDCGARCVVTDKSLAEGLSSPQRRLILADAPGETAAAGEATGRGPRAATPGDLAYVLYTSGSTGTPKGVMVEHRSAAALLDWAESRFEPAELACVLAATSVCFDLSIFEIFVPLCAGHSVVLADSVLALPSLPARGSITLINTVPSMMRGALRLQEGSFPPSLRVVNLAGERLDNDLVEEVYRRTGAAKVYDLYGPTEATTYSTCKLRLPGEPPSIGRPIANTRAYVLDEQGQPVPIGVVGELHLAGDGLARGYWKREALTAERFVRPRSDRIPEQRLYRTGDLARYRGDGELEFCGRRDAQLKIRGVRIEPGEVRAALMSLEHVQDAMVLGRPDEAGERHLAAYVVGDSAVLSAARVRAHLVERLPSALVPSMIVVVTAFPLSPNGKVDLERLRAMGPEAIRREPSPPSTDTERAVLAIWRELLTAESFGVDDGFFDLGGHSMNAMLVIGRLNAAFATELPLRAIFEHTTVRALSALVDRTPRGSALPPLQRHPEGDALVTLLQRHVWLVDHAAEDSAFLNIWHWIGVRGAFDVSAAHRAIGALLERYPILTSRFTWRGGSLRQLASRDARIEQAFEDVSGALDEQEKDDRLRAFCHGIGAPLNVREGECCRFAVVRLASEHHALIMVFHHIVVDEWSIAILARELMAFYAAASRGEAPGLAPPPFTFGDYAAWEQRCRHSGLFEEQLAAWAEWLKPPLSRLALPWQSEAAGPRAGAITHRFELSAPLRAEIGALARRERTSLFVVLLSALKALLRRKTGETDIRVSTNIARRHRRELESMIGPLTDTMVLRSLLPPDIDPLGTLREVRAGFLQACGAQDVPFEDIAAKLASLHGVPRQSLAQVFFLFHDEDPPIDAPSELSVASKDATIELGGDFFGAAVHGYDVILYLASAGGRVEGQLSLANAPAGVAADIARDYLSHLEEMARAEERSARIPAADP